MPVAPGRPAVVLDASVLINFLRVDRMDLIGNLPLRFAITEHVSAEVSEHYAEQRSRLEAALTACALEQHAVRDPAALSFFRRLMDTGRLGAGESAAIAYAAVNGFALAIDDRRAAREAHRLIPGLAVVGTADLIVVAIQAGLITVPEADAIKDDWTAKHRFRLSEASVSCCRRGPSAPCAGAAIQNTPASSPAATSRPRSRHWSRKSSRHGPRQRSGSWIARQRMPVTIVSTPRRVPVPSWPARM